MTTNHSENQ